MGRVEELEQAIQGLSGQELKEFRRWYQEFDTEARDRQMKAVSRAGKLDAPAEEAIGTEQSHGERRGPAAKSRTIRHLEKEMLKEFKDLLLKRAVVHKLVLFGSRARGDDEPGSDMDVLVILEGGYDWDLREYISRCAWEVGFERGILVVPVIFSQDEWEKGPESVSLFAQAVKAEGIPV
jgi:predicted nucleotidyltransferase